MNKRVFVIIVILVVWVLNAPLLHMQLNGQDIQFSIVESVETDIAEKQMLTPVFILELFN